MLTRSCDGSRITQYWDRFHIDITNCLTVSSMAMKIYRTHYYPSTYPIYRPQPNRAAFIRKGYYGGHTDVYIPYGKGLFYYDVNSLYPYAMTKPMPGGKPVWHGKLDGCDLDLPFSETVDARRIITPTDAIHYLGNGGCLRAGGSWFLLRRWESCTTSSWKTGSLNRSGLWRIRTSSGVLCGNKQCEPLGS